MLAANGAVDQSKGDTAFVEEGARQTVTYKDCVGRKK